MAKKKAEVVEEVVGTEVEETEESGAVSGYVEKMSFILEDLKKNANRFDRGIKAEGTRVRRGMQELKAIAQTVRMIVAETRDKMAPDPDRAAKARERSLFTKRAAAKS